MDMGKKAVLVGVVLLTLVSGCSLSEQVNRDIEMVLVDDGVNEAEAVTMAQHQLLLNGHASRFDAGKPDFSKDILLREYPEYWFIAFPPKSHMNYTLNYLVVIKKEDGDITFAGEYRPMRVKDYDFVFK